MMVKKRGKSSCWLLPQWLSTSKFGFYILLYCITQSEVHSSMYLKFSIKNIRDESLDIFRGKFLSFWFIFRHVILCQVDQADSWYFLSINSKELRDTAVVFYIRINENKENLSFKFLGSSRESIMNALELISLFASEKQNMLLYVSTKYLGCILTKTRLG